ncbi:tetratricopeptide repeat protein [Roseibium sp.]|uniref:tetratricopeptide repeat protein n=2 Tax=unclassified Roseibium TaxID=2629323 RepID=UPI003BA9B327
MPWPKAYSCLLAQVEKRLGAEGTMCLSRELRGGKSGAQVLVADVHSSDYTGQAILKLDKAWDPVHGGRPEPELLMQAIESSPEFAGQHLPRLLYSFHDRDQFGILLTIAGRGLEYADPWPDVPFEKQLPVIRHLSKDLLAEWNKNYRLSDGIHMPQDLLSSWLGYRLVTGSGGRIHTFLSKECGLDFHDPSFTFEGQWFPNPLAFAEGVVDLHDRLHIRAVKGHSHGDLHGMNLLVGQEDPANPDYFLIDLADYDSDQFLFFDHAYFELSHLLMSRKDRDAAYWEGLFENLSHRNRHKTARGLQADDLGLMEIVSTLRSGIKDWIETYEPDRLSFMESQCLLARVAAGLNFAHKNIDPRMRRIAFLYAALSLKDYLQLNRVDWPKHGPSFSIGCAEAPERTTSQALLPEKRQATSRSNTSGRDITTARAVPVSAPKALSKQDHNRHSFFDELRRRNVVKVAAGYIVVAWLCLQVALVLQSTLKLPEWTDSLVATLLALGFPIACVLAWAYELSPTGLQRTTELGQQAPPSKSETALNYLLGIGVVLILTISVANPIYGRFLPSLNEPVIGDDHKSIAVLPFKNLSRMDESDNFSDGLTVELMSTLARTGQFRVPGLSSSFSFKDKNEDLRVIGKELGVDYILEGSVRHVDGDFRIEAQLVEADDGFLIWSDVFDESQEDLFQIQEKIALQVGEALNTPLQITADALMEIRTSNARAYELFLQGLGLYQQRGAALQEAADLLNEAVSLDPDFAAGWAALSLVYNVYPNYIVSDDEGRVDTAFMLSRSQEFALRANLINPELPLVQYAMANTFRRNRQWSEAEDMYRAALDQVPDAYDVLEDYAELLSMLGRHEQAIAMAEHTTQADPFNSVFQFRELEAKWAADPSAGNAKKLIAFFEEKSPQREPIARPMIGYMVKTGQTDELRALIAACNDCDPVWKTRVMEMINSIGKDAPEDIFEEYKNDNFMGYTLLNAIGGPDLALKAYLHYALALRRSAVSYSVPWTVIDSVGSEEQFKFLVEQTGILDYWRERGWPDRCRPLEGDDFECS